MKKNLISMETFVGAGGSYLGLKKAGFKTIYVNEIDKNLFLLKHLSLNSNVKTNNNYDLVNYFNKYHAFCLDLHPDKVLKGNLNFNY